MLTNQHVPDLVWNQVTEKRPAASATANQVLLRRARYLPEGSQHLLHLWLVGRHSIRRMAQVQNVNPGNLWRHLNSLKSRLLDPVVAALADFGQTLDPDSRQMGLDYYLHRRPLIEIIRNRDMSFREAEQLMIYLKAWAEIAPLLTRDHPLAIAEAG